MVSPHSFALAVCAAALLLQPAATGAEQSKHPMTRTLADGPPFPGTRSPDQILANLAAAIRQMGLGARHKTVAQMAEKPKIRRLLEVEDELGQGDFYLLELENATGQYIGMAAIRKDGRLRGIAAGDGVTEPTERVADLTEVQKVIGPRFGASRARYRIGITSVDIYQEYYPMIVADSPSGAIFVTRRLEAYRETQRIARAQRTDAARHGVGVPTIGKPAYVTKSGDVLVLEPLGSIRQDLAKPDR